MSEVWLPLHVGEIWIHVCHFPEKCSNHQAGRGWFRGKELPHFTCESVPWHRERDTSMFACVRGAGGAFPSPKHPQRERHAVGICNLCPLEPNTACVDAGGICKESNAFSSLPGQSECEQWFLGRTISLAPRQVGFDVVVRTSGDKAGASKVICMQKWIPVFPVLWEEDGRG